MARSPLTAGLVPHLRRAALASADGGLTDGQLLGEFLRARDEAAFAALVRRHGPMVLGVCRRVVGDAHAAEDAFQATFLVLARRAQAVRPRDRLGGWLYGVAYRTALKARSALARRRAKEKPVDPILHPAAPPPDSWADVGPVLDAELARLPDRLRLPVVLCDLEGRPQREAARQLGLPPATLANRLAAARRQLAARLTARGVTLSGGALAAVVSANAAMAVPPGLAAQAVRVALGAVPAHIAHLSEGVIRMMLLTKLKAAAVTALAVLTVVGGVGVGTLPAARADDKPADPKPAAPAKPALGPRLGDREFLTQTCLTLRGNLPTEVEMDYFLADPDPGKRKKVVNWLADGEEAASAAEGRLTMLDTDDGAFWAVAPRWLAAGSADGKLYYLLDQSTSMDRRLNLNRLWVEVAGGDAPRGVVVNEVCPDGAVRVWDLDVGDSRLRQYLGWKVAGVNADDSAALVNWLLYAADPHPDEEFLRRVSHDLRGTPPTRIEREYFRADQDPKKREKLLDLLARDPEVAKKLAADWKKKYLAGQTAQAYRSLMLRYYRAPRARLWLTHTLPAPAAKHEALLGQLLEAKKPDDQVLDALAAAALGRLPTESERKLILAQVGKAQDKRAAWREVLVTLADTDEAKKHAEGTTKPADPPKK
jgi:RNA polymerase sigma factor (sigma-70 family)